MPVQCAKHSKSYAQLFFRLGQIFRHLGFRQCFCDFVIAQELVSQQRLRLVVVLVGDGSLYHAPRCCRGGRLALGLPARRVTAVLVDHEKYFCGGFRVGRMALYFILFEGDGDKYPKIS